MMRREFWLAVLAVVIGCWIAGGAAIYGLIKLDSLTEVTGAH